MRSPCFDCGLKSADKNGAECLKCEKRWEYVGRLAGEDAGAGNSGPDDIKTKRRVQMSIRGTCRNCGRDNMTLVARGLCGLCNNAYAQAPDNGKEAALAAAKARVQGGFGVAPGHRKNGPRTQKKKSATSTSVLERLRVPEAISDPSPAAAGVLSIADPSAWAEKTMRLRDLFDFTFGKNDERYLKIAIMAAISDAYQKGVSDSRN